MKISMQKFWHKMLTTDGNYRKKLCREIARCIDWE